MNDDIVHRDEAQVLVFDSGFMLGDGMREGMGLFQRTLGPVFDSGKAVSPDVGGNRAGIKEAWRLAAEANDMHADVHCRLMLTRGITVDPFQHPSLSRSGPTLVIINEPSKPAANLRWAGILSGHCPAGAWPARE